MYINKGKGLIAGGLFFLVCLLGLCLAKAQDLSHVDFLSEDEKKWIAEHPEIRVAHYTNWPPLTFMQDGQVRGFSIDYLNLIAEKTGLNITYVPNEDWPTLMEMGKRGDVDIMTSFARFPDREDYWNFSSPYINLIMTFYGKVGDEPIINSEDLDGKRIGAVKTWSSYNFLMESHPEFTTVGVDSVEEGLEALANGEIDVFADRIPTTSYVMLRDNITDIEVVGRSVLREIEETVFLRFGIRKDWPVLAGIIEKAMSRVSEAEYEEASNRWKAVYDSKSDVSLTLEEYGWLAENKVIRVASVTNFAPITLVDETGQISGVTGAYLDVIAKRLNVKFEWIGVGRWSHGLDAVRNGDADIITSIEPRPEREEYLNFTDSYLSLTNMIFTRSGGVSFGNMDGLIGRRIAQVRGIAITEDIKRDYPGIEVVEVDSTVEALKMVAGGQVDAFIGTFSLSALKIASEGLDEVVVSGETNYRSNYAYGIRKDMPFLASAMQKAVDSMTVREKQLISQQWLSARFERAPDYTLLWQVVVGFVVLLSIILFWVHSLRREVERRQVVELELKESRALAQVAQSNAECALAEAEQANNAKSNFLANMSHEIRTPLNAIIGFSEIMSDEVFGVINEPKYRDYIKDIHNSGQHLATVINDILDLSKIEAGKWELEEQDIEMNEVIREALKIVENSAAEKNIVIKANGIMDEQGMVVRGDANCLKRIFINLLSNSVKFTEPGGQIGCDVSQTGQGDLTMSISDTGIGIPQDRIEKVLNPFEQGNDSVHVNETGTGLGLSIVKQLVELHDGQFVLESAVNVGTTAFVTLPSKRIIH